MLTRPVVADSPHEAAEDWLYEYEVRVGGETPACGVSDDAERAKCYLRAAMLAARTPGPADATDAANAADGAGSGDAVDVRGVVRRVELDFGTLRGGYTVLAVIASCVLEGPGRLRWR